MRQIAKMIINVKIHRTRIPNQNDSSDFCNSLNQWRQEPLYFQPSFIFRRIQNTIPTEAYEIARMSFYADIWLTEKEHRGLPIKR